MFDASAVGRVLFIAWLFMPAFVALVGMMLLEWRRATRTRQFWCGTAGRTVNVMFVADTVRACTAFEPADAITCGRACLHPGAPGRRQAA